MRKTVALLWALTLGWVAWAASGGDYFPLTQGRKWVYTWNDSRRSFEYTVEVAKVEGDRALVRTVMPNVLTQEWYHSTEQGPELTGLEDPDGARAEYQPCRPYLRYPLTRGLKWEWSGKLGQAGPISDRNRVVGEARVQAPAGMFDCVVVETITTQGQGSLNQTSYYASDVGLVKYVCESSAGKWVSQLKAFKPGPAR